MPDIDLVVHQGDDTDFNGQTNYWVLPAGDYTGYSARYSVGTVNKAGTISTGTDANGNSYNYVSFVLTKTETASIPPGIYQIFLKLFDANSKCATVDGSVLIKIVPQEVNNGN